MNLITKIEKKYNFKFIPKLMFESKEEEAKIKKMAKKATITAEMANLGNQIKLPLPKVSVRFINESLGNGLILEEDICANSYVGEYTGIVRKNSFLLVINRYLFKYPIEDAPGKNYFIDAQEKGNLTRFINHSSNPNLEAHVAYHQELFHIVFITNQKIVKGSQLLFNYGFRKKV